MQLYLRMSAVGGQEPLRHQALGGDQATGLQEAEDHVGNVVHAILQRVRPIGGEDDAHVAGVVGHDVEAPQGCEDGPVEVRHRRDAGGEVLEHPLRLLHLRVRVQLQHADREVHPPGGHEDGGVNPREALQHDVLTELVHQLAELGVLGQGYREEVRVLKLGLLLLAEQFNLGLAAVDLLLLSGAQPDRILLVLAVRHDDAGA
mmetsp:Transcript_6223/g.18694  ORF Transcript_6223/g.18694 Transcript_6223/m.18694 type:complete len:203 (-) Transcript_6223:166-774(-)